MIAVSDVNKYTTVGISVFSVISLLPSICDISVPSTQKSSAELKPGTFKPAGGAREMAAAITGSYRDLTPRCRELIRVGPYLHLYHLYNLAGSGWR